MKDDAALVADARALGPEAFGPIIARYKDAVFGVALARLQHFHDAEDITQSAFIEAFEHLDGLKDPHRLGAWLRSIVVHRCINHLRRRSREVDIEAIDEPRSDRPTPHAEMERRELQNRVMTAIARLSKVQRETVTLFYINGYSQQEVATIQEVPLGTIKRRLHDARYKLKEDMVAMVEDVLKENAPKEDFTERVFRLLCVYPAGELRLFRADIRVELERIGAPGMDGFIKAFDLPHWQTRRTAVHYLQAVSPTEYTLDLLKRALIDRNKKVRKHAATALMRMDIPEERMRKEFLPLIVPLLSDRSRSVRARLALPWMWARWVADIPVDAVITAIEGEQDPHIRMRKQRLLTAVLKAKDKKTDPA